jgi:heme exporter protein C
MKTTDRVLLWLLLPAIAVGLYFAFIYAPTEKVMGTVQRIFYFHVASAWTALLSFFFVFVGGVMYLWKKDVKYDHFSYAATELGVLFSSIVLVTGPIWAKPVWNVWWTWDPRLTSTFILWLIYVAYLLFRSSLRDNPAIRTYSAIYGIIGFADVPIVWMSIHWWRTIHPRVISLETIRNPQQALDPKMWVAVFVCWFAIMLLYVTLLRIRMTLEKTREHVETVQQTILEANV